MSTYEENGETTIANCFGDGSMLNEVKRILNILRGVLHQQQELESTVKRT